MLRHFTVAVFVSFLWIAFCTDVRADVTPAPSPSPDISATARLGYVKPIATREEYQPEMDDFADSVLRQFQEALSVKVLYLVGAGLKKAITAGACDDDHLSGLIVTRKEWTLTERAVSVQATVRIVDCEGKPFFETVGSYQEHRNTVFDGQAQVVDVQSKAIANAIRDVVDYKNSHAPKWDQLMRTGSVDASPGAAAPASSTTPAAPHATGS